MGDSEARQRIFSALTYDDAPAAIEWLGRAFGFEQKFVAPGPDEGTVGHAELRLEGNLIMLGSSGVGLDMKSPRELGGTNHCVYVVVGDPDAHYERATAVGAEIVREINDTDYGSREYVCRDPEGNLWSFGTYDPFASG